MLEIIPTDNPEQWNKIVRSMSEYDFYHLAEYHRLDTSGEAFLLYFHCDTGALALPVIVRNIKGTNYKDITSVYGYSGPLSSVKNPDPDTVCLFHEALIKQFDTLKIVSAFARLHPLFENQSLLLNGLGEVADMNLTVAINLTWPLAEQRSQYARSLKNEINRWDKSGLVVKKAEKKEEIDDFIAIYMENMKRVNASAMYFFPPVYFYDFLSDIDSAILLAYYQDIPISGSLFTVCNGIVQLHLNATKNEYLALSPLKYVWDKIRIMGTESKLKYMHVGGGFGGKNDNLFEFKSRFSKQRFVFKIWKYIHNREIYDKWVREKHGDHFPETVFFPLYRYGDL